MEGYDILRRPGFKTLWESLCELCNNEAREYAKHIPADFQEVFYHRLRLRFQEFIYLGILYALKWDLFAKTHYRKWFAEIHSRESVGFLKDLEQYEERHGEKITGTVTRARTGDDEAIYRLIKWDKAFLGHEFVLSHIAQRQRHKDENFFLRMGTILQEKSDCGNTFLESKHETMSSFVQFCLDAQPNIEPSDDSEKGTLKTLDELLHDVGALEGEEEVMPVEDRDYFTDLVRRYSRKFESDTKA